MSLVESIIAGLLAEGPQLFTDIATGEGGVAKIDKVASDLTAILGVVAQAKAAATAPAATPAAS